jgi:hypothetical protein
MKTPKYELGKLKRIINWQGKDYTFTSTDTNDFGEPIEGSTSVVVKGIFHQTSSYVTVTTSTGSQMLNTPQPMILADYEEAKVLKKDNKLTIGATNYKVTKVTDVSNFGIIADISLEVIQ